MISNDQCGSVKGNLRNMFNVVGTFVLCAEDFWKVFKESFALPCMRTRLTDKTTEKWPFYWNSGIKYNQYRYSGVSSLISS